ncbi:MAG: hypothetical protein GY929_09250 [Actinomycetia bacterium]|nr:hypothetical protein [Actinomycetes bacterium]
MDDTPSGENPPGRVEPLPPVGARVLAVTSIIVAGVCGGLIGYAFTDLQVDGDNIWPALGGLAGAVIGAGGVAIVAVLVLRAMGEWQATGSRGG